MLTEIGMYNLKTSSKTSKNGKASGKRELILNVEI
jgi:hypothetical protein